VSAPFSFTISHKLALFLILVISIIIVIDSNVIKFFTYTYEELTIVSNLEMFTGFSVAFSIFAILVLRNIPKRDLKSKYRGGIALDSLHMVVQASQFTVIGVLIITILQMSFLNIYNSFLINLIVYISFGSSLLFMILLVLLLAGWFKSSKNYMIISYAISFLILSAYLVLSMIYVALQYTYHSDWIEATPIHLALVNFPKSDLGLSFGLTLDALSLLSFVLLWTATLGLLRQYRNRVGKIRFYIFMSIPLIYFLFPFETYFGEFFEGFLSVSPIIFSLIYLLLFSATKQVGGVLFSIVFLTAAAIVNQRNLRNSLIIAAIGIAVLFGSTEIDSLLYAAYPPYGVLTIMLMPLGSYLLYSGIFESARFLSRDKLLRKEFFQSAEKQLNFLKTIGVVEMEKELEKNLRSILKKSSLQEETVDYGKSDGDVRELVQEVIHELQLKKINDKQSDEK